MVLSSILITGDNCFEILVAMKLLEKLNSEDTVRAELSNVSTSSANDHTAWSDQQL